MEANDLVTRAEFIAEKMDSVVEQFQKTANLPDFSKLVVFAHWKLRTASSNEFESLPDYLFASLNRQLTGTSAADEILHNKFSPRSRVDIKETVPNGIYRGTQSI